MKQPTYFSSYIAGFWEGDGHADRRFQSSIAFTLHQKNAPFLHFLHHHLGGSVRYKAKNHAYVLTIQKKVSLEKVFKHFHKSLRTPKHHDLQSFSWSVGPKDGSCLLSNAWLAGFIDAEGGFKIRWTKEQKDPVSQKILTKHRIGVSFVLEQRKVHPLTGESFAPVMQKICAMFQVPLHQRQHNGKWYWCVEVSGLKKLDLVIKYLESFPLLSSKRLDFEDWKQAYRLLCAGEHGTEKGKAEIWSLKQGMNRQRRVFCWKHLEV